MAESLGFGRSIDRGSDQVPEHFCEPCFERNDKIKPVAGYCQNCNENLCIKCYTGHHRRKLFQDHKLVDKSTRPKTKTSQQNKPKNLGEECLLHHGETIQSFCNGHSQFCCKVCLTIDHQACKTEKISKLARNVHGSQELQNLIEKLNTLKKGFNDNLSKTRANEIVIQKNHRNAINEMKKLQDEFDKLMTKTKAQAERVKEEDFDKIEKVAATCNIVTEQLNKLATNLDTLKEKGENEQLFVSMKRAESRLISLQGSQEKIGKENVVREYKFDPNARLMTLLKDFKVLGQLLFEQSGSTGIPQQMKRIGISKQSMRQAHVMDLTVSSFETHVYGSLALPNNQILVTDYRSNKLKLIDTNQDKIISEIKVSGSPLFITKVNDNEFAVIIHVYSSKIQFISLYPNSLSKGREMSVNGKFNGIAYNARDQTLIVASNRKPGYIQVINMSGSVIKCLDKASKGDNLFAYPQYVALTPDMTEMYVTDSDKNTVTLMTMNGDVKAVYKDKSLKEPYGICVNKLRCVYVVGRGSNTIHQLDPVSGTFKLLLDKKDGIVQPVSISFSDLEDKMYIGMEDSTILKVFQIK